MSRDDKIDGIDAVQPVSSERLAHIYKTVNERVIQENLENVRSVEWSEAATEGSKVSESLSKNLETIFHQLVKQQDHDQDFVHSDNFFRRFMRAASVSTSAININPVVSNKNVLSSASLKGAHARPATESEKTVRQGELAADCLRDLGVNGFSREDLERVVRRYRMANKDETMSFSGQNVPDEMALFWDREPVYGLARERRRERRWGDQFLLNTYDGNDPLYFDHATTYYPIELTPPPDVDFIPFEYYAAVGISAGWQGMVDDFVRQDAVIDRRNASSLDVFLLNYSLLIVQPTELVSGALAHFPSEENMQRLLEYLERHDSAKAKVRVELLNAAGQTVAEVWLDLGVMRRRVRKKM